MGSFYRSQHELVFVWKVGTAAHLNTIELGRHGRYRTNVWSYAGVNTLKANRMDELSMHPTVKPVALVSDAIKDASKRGDLVIDAFGGSGTSDRVPQDEASRSVDRDRRAVLRRDREALAELHGLRSRACGDKCDL